MEITRRNLLLSALAVQPILSKPQTCPVLYGRARMGGTISYPEHANDANDLYAAANICGEGPALAGPFDGPMGWVAFLDGIRKRPIASSV